jgi:hypothetical protein
MSSTQELTPSPDLEPRIARLQRLVEISLILNSTLELEPLLEVRKKPVPQAGSVVS